MLTKKSKKRMQDYMDTLPLIKECRDHTTYWFLPETDADEWIAVIDVITCRVVTGIRVEEHPSFGPEIVTYNSFPFQDFKLFKDAVDHAMQQAEEAQRKYYFMRKEWKAAKIKDCAENFEV